MNLEFQIKKNKDKGMTLPELILAMAMLTAFKAVFVVVMQFIAIFFQTQNISSDKSSEKEFKDLLNDHMQINESFDYIEEFLSQPGFEKEEILGLKCTSLPYLDWDIPSLNSNAIPSSYKVCIQPSRLDESSYIQLNQSQGKPGIYILYAKPNDGITYKSIPIRRIFCRPKPFCRL